LNAHLTNGVSHSKADRINESTALVAQESSGEEDGLANPSKPPQPDLISISSGIEESSSEEDDEEDGAEAQARQDGARPAINGHASGDDGQATTGADDTDMKDADTAEELSFGDMLQVRHPEPIDVTKTVQSYAGQSSSLVPTGTNSGIQAPTAGSLGTVLTQALKTNDKDLLESCFAIADVNAIRATIQRQQSQQIALLLERIAERIHKRPGRAGRMIVWVQWSLVSHGGYLANQPELMRKLKALAQVTRERANGLQPLLHLKGKLDLLSAQLEARRGMLAISRAANAEDLDHEQDVLFIEGQEAEWSSDGETVKLKVSKSKKPGRKMVDDSEAGSSVDDDLPNGFINGVEDDSSADEDDVDQDGLIDDEAEETSDDEGSSNEDGDSDASSIGEEDDSSDEEESEVEAVKQPKPQTLNRKR
jgi:U3 small nucleolar RNA-associated protein 5